MNEQLEKYRPSNGTEGEIFMDNHCMQCIHCDPDPDGEKQCEILARALCYDTKDEEYPEEWVYKNDEPTCTKWVKWDWGKDGDPDDEPTEPIDPIDPNQLMLFSITDEILLSEEVRV